MTLSKRIQALAHKLNTSEIVISAIYNLAKNGEHFKQIWTDPTEFDLLQIKNALAAKIFNSTYAGEFEKDEKFYWGEKSFTLSTLDNLRIKKTEN